MTWADWAFLGVTVLPTLVWLVGLFTNALTYKVVTNLGTVTPNKDLLQLRDGEEYLLSVVIPACNEEGSVGPTLEGMLGQTIPLEVVVVNDRSTDSTGQIIDEFATKDERVQAIHIDHLPEGWLGKLNALHQGVQHCKGRWLLFADADVVLSPDALASAISYAEERELNLVTALPKVLSAGIWADMALNATSSMMGPAAKLWQVPDPDSSVAAGFGAFILIRNEAFQQTPGFPWIKLEVADDVGLGLMVKQYAGKCEIVVATQQMKLQFYDSYLELMRKTQKNFFGIVGRFSALRVWGLATAFLYLSWFPLALFLPYTQSWFSWIPVVGGVAMVACNLMMGVWMARPLFPSLFSPVGMLLCSFIMYRAGWIGWREGGIQWRGMLYPSEQLRDEQRVKL